MSKLENKVAIITGSGRGIGRAIALKLASEGATVVINDLDQDVAQQAAEAISEIGGKAIVVAGDVTKPSFGDEIVRKTLAEFGALDIIVNNAGYTWDNVIQKMTDEQFQTMLDVHLLAPFRILRAAARHFRSAAKEEVEKGQEVFRKVVNISSIAGTGGNAGQVNYAAAKSGIVGVTKALAAEWGRYKINVNAVAYGLISTRLTGVLDDESGTINIGERTIAVGIEKNRRAMAEKMIPLGRAGTPEEAAGAVYMFCIPESNYVTGQTLICGGGIGRLA